MEVQLLTFLNASKRKSFFLVTRKPRVCSVMQTNRLLIAFLSIFLTWVSSLKSFRLHWECDWTDSNILVINYLDVLAHITCTNCAIFVQIYLCAYWKMKILKLFLQWQNSLQIHDYVMLASTDVIHDYENEIKSKFLDIVGYQHEQRKLTLIDWGRGKQNVLWTQNCQWSSNHTAFPRSLWLSH